VDFIPIVNFNGDKIIDTADLVTLIEHWGSEEPLCDIGPLPLGNGVVDDTDLAVLMNYWGREAFDPSLIAHWPFDEVQGVIAYDDAGTYDGTLVGGPAWQPDVGIVDGALQFDGLDDYVETDPILNPADGVFSVVAWIQAGAPGQVVISGAMGSNWLMLDAEGRLMTELESPGRSSPGPLLSEASVTDPPEADWHWIGFVWDGSYRHLYVDGVEVATDDAPLPVLEGSEGGLYLGAGSTLAPGTFFSGLIDDVRIYNRAVSP